MFVRYHVEEMVRELPHLRLFAQPFESGGAVGRIIKEYVKDECLKFNQTHEAYLRRKEEIREFLATNEKIEKSNQKQSVERLKKSLLAVPKQTPKPLHRIFRNTDILKSMVRSWFELEYKKWLKKNAYG